LSPPKKPKKRPGLARIFRRSSTENFTGNLSAIRDGPDSRIPARAVTTGRVFLLSFVRACSLIKIHFLSLVLHGAVSIRTHTRARAHFFSYINNISRFFRESVYVRDAYVRNPSVRERSITIDWLIPRARQWRPFSRSEISSANYPRVRVRDVLWVTNCSVEPHHPPADDENRVTILAFYVKPLSRHRYRTPSGQHSVRRASKFRRSFDVFPVTRTDRRHITLLEFRNTQSRFQFSSNSLLRRNANLTVVRQMA